MQWQEAETAYKNAVAVCNECQYQVHVSAQVGIHSSLIVQVLISCLFLTQKSILCAYRRQVMEFDIQLRDVSYLYSRNTSCIIHLDSHYYNFLRVWTLTSLSSTTSSRHSQIL